MKVFRAFGAIVVVALLTFAGCKDSGSIPSGSVQATGNLRIRMIGVNRDVLFPNAGPALWLFAGKPPGVDQRSYILFESVDGLNFNRQPFQPTAVLSDSVWYELPMPGANRHYSVTARASGKTIGSNRVKVQPNTAGPAINMTSPTNGSSGVDVRTKFVWTQATGISSYALLTADLNIGIIDTMIETNSTTFTIGGSATYYIRGPVPLKPVTPYGAAVFAIDGFAWGISATPLVTFTTRP